MRVKSREPRTGYRFGFQGTRIRELPEHQEATVDDILESLGRHSQLSDQLGPRENSESGMGREELFDSPVQSGFYSRRPGGSFGRYAFSLMLFGGVTILLLFAFTSAVLGSYFHSTFGIRSIIGLVLGDPVKLGLLGILCLVPVVMVRKRRGGSGVALSRIQSVSD